MTDYMCFTGHRFRRECKSAGKKLMVWTVNDRRQMMEVGIILFLYKEHVDV